MYDNRQPIRIVRGTTNGFTVTVKDDAGDPYAISEGEVVRFGVKRTPSDTQYLIVKENTTTSATGEYGFSISPSDTENLAFGSYWYDVGLQSGSDYFNIVVASPFEISYNVTEWED